MTQPSRPSHATERTSAESRGPPDQTVPRAETVSGGSPAANPDAPAFAPPEHAGEVGKLGRYRVLKELGRGGMGAVYLGYDSTLDRKVALKVMLPNHAASRDARERFLREARTAAMVKSDHVVTIFDVAEERGIPFIAMQYLLGHPLDQYLKTKGELPLAHVLRVGRETALGLAAAHELGLIHRDIKPANLWLEAPKGRVKLLDFGLARAENDDVHLTNTGAVIGTPAYMSPEQGRGEKVDHRTDLFSLGVLLYRLATGRAPFRGANTMAILTSLAVDTPAPVRQLNPEVPEALEAIIDRLLAKNPDERIQTAMEVVAALREIEHPKAAPGPRPVVVPLQSVPMAITAQTQNVWEGIDDSESVPAPLATSAETEADPSPAPKPARKQPERKASKLPLILAGVGLLAAVAVLIAVMGPKKTNPPVVENTEPPEKRPPTPVVKPPAAPDPDRKAAEYVLSIGGVIKVSGEEKEISVAAELPKGQFSLVSVNLIDNKKVTDVGFANFKDCKSLTELQLIGTSTGDAGLVFFKDCKNLTVLTLGATNVSDTGLVNFKDCKNLTYLDLNRTKVGDVGLTYFKDCKNLSIIGLSETQVSDIGLANFKDCKDLTGLWLDNTKVGNTGLANFKGCKSLTRLHVLKTKVTKEAIEEFHKGLPQCRIEHDGGTIEAKDIEREVTTQLLGRAGSDLLLILPDGRELRVKKPAEIPPGPFAIDAINVRTPFSDADLKRLEPLRRLRILNLIEGNTVSTDGLRSVLAHKSTLDWLNLDRGPITDEGLKIVGQLPELTFLGLSNTKVTNNGLKHLTGLKKLRQLELENAPVTDAAIDTLAEMKSLVLLNVKGTKLTEPRLKQLSEKLPRCRITHDKGVIGPLDADRMAAEYVLSIGGTVGVNGGQSGLFKTAADLPKERFTLTYVTFGFGNTRVTDEGLAIFKDCTQLASIHLPASKVGDLGLAHFQNCKGLVELNLRETHVTDDGLAYFKECKQLQYLDLGYTKVTDAGLSHLKDCKKLSQLSLHATGVGDKGMANFTGCKELTHVGLWATQVSDAVLDQLKECKQLVQLDVRSTQVTAAKVAEFAKTLPKCEVLHESVEPKK